RGVAGRAVAARVGGAGVGIVGHVAVVVVLLRYARSVADRHLAIAYGLGGDRRIVRNVVDAARAVVALGRRARRGSSAIGGLKALDTVAPRVAVPTAADGPNRDRRMRGSARVAPIDSARIVVARGVAVVVHRL